MMKLSVIIPCFNAAGTIGTQLEALAKQRWSEPWEVIVSDNGSNDETLSVVERYRDRIKNLKVVDSSNQRGAAHARNVGANASTGIALAFCDADDEVATGWVAAIGEALSRYDLVASRFEARKLNAPWIYDACGIPQQEGIQEYTYPDYLPHSGGSGLGVKRIIHESVGGFDKSWPVLEETDYCWRIQLKGIKLQFVPDALVHVRLRDTVWGFYNQIKKWGEYNVLIYKKYRPHGMPKLSWKRGARAWLSLFMQIPRIRTKGEAGKWVWIFGYRLGRMQGCIKYKVLAP